MGAEGWGKPRPPIIIAGHTKVEKQSQLSITIAGHTKVEKQSQLFVFIWEIKIKFQDSKIKVT